MSTNGVDRIRTIFAAARELPEDARAAYLSSACESDRALRDEVESLLVHDGAAAAFLTRPVAEAYLADAGLSHPPVQRIGGYRIEKTLSSGGFGTVYLAVQDHPRRTVAVKVMNHGIASASRRRRFEYEAQLLGQLAHPNIAQIYEAGTYATDGGELPYFAMEYVPSARTITAYASECRLNVRERLQLFVTVCTAVHYGHQKGIVHRDIKPQNILVDACGRPKIIDFGIARTTDVELAAVTRTRAGDLIGTPEYMSPEQCACEPLAIDTRTDVYSLGVVLYELLCHQLPHALADKPVPEKLRIIREEAPIRPRGVNRHLHRDVETIALKALEKIPERRYRSAADLGDDIHRFLENEPIEARPPSVAYQVRMLAKRHKGALGAATAVLVALGAGFAVGTWRLAAASYERERNEERLASAREVNRLLRDTDRSLARVGSDGAVEARLLLATSGLGLLESLGPAERDDPEFFVELAQQYEALADVLGGARGPNMGRADEALRACRGAHGLWRTVTERRPDDADARLGLVRTNVKMADLLQEHDAPAALEACSEACAIARALESEDPANTAFARALVSALLERGDVYRKLGRRDAAWSDTRGALAVLEGLDDDARESEPIRRDLATTWLRIGHMAREEGRCDDAREWYVRNFDARSAAAAARPDARTRRDLLWATHFLWDFAFECGDAPLARTMLTDLGAQAVSSVALSDTGDLRSRHDTLLLARDLAERAAAQPERLDELREAMRAFRDLLAARVEPTPRAPRTDEAEVVEQLTSLLDGTTRTESNGR